VPGNSLHLHRQHVNDASVASNGINALPFATAFPFLPLSSSFPNATNASPDKIIPGMTFSQIS